MIDVSIPFLKLKFISMKLKSSFLYSHHEYSEGYWIEIDKPTNLFGTIIDVYDIIDIRDNKIKEILNEEEKNISI